MNVDELVTHLTQQGVQLWTEQEKLKIQSPKGLLTSQIRAMLSERKTEILAFLKEQAASDTHCLNATGISLETIGRLISGIAADSQSPVIEPTQMARKLKVTFRPIASGTNSTIAQFRETLREKLAASGVQILAWEQATYEFRYSPNLPGLKGKNFLKTHVVRSDINAVIDVERQPTRLGQIKTWFAELIYQGYCRWFRPNHQLSAAKIIQLMGWADENIRVLEDPTNTQTIILGDIDSRLNDPSIPYPQKIPLGISRLVRTFSEIIIGVSPTHLSILNMNLSDSTFPIEEVDRFITQSLIPKIYVPILPLSLSRFVLEEYEPTQSAEAAKLRQLSHHLADTGLFPNGFKINEVVKRQSHRDIINWLVKGRTGVSYGFIAYAESPQYRGKIELSPQEWQTLFPVEGFNFQELRQNQIGRRYLKIQSNEGSIYRQIPDIWLLSSRSGANKTALDLNNDILRIGLREKLYLQLPSGIDLATADIKPSYDIYVMVAIVLAAALYLPKLLENGMPIVHFHGYPASDWFGANEYYTGVDNPSVPCGTYESGVFNFLGIYHLAQQYKDSLTLASLIEPDHGTNIIASDLNELLKRLKSGTQQEKLTLGGQHFSSLKTYQTNH